MENTFTYEGKEYELYKRYKVDGEPNKVFFFKKYTKKDGKCKYYKYFNENKGTKSKGRPRTKKRLVIDQIKEMTKEQVEIMYDFMNIFKRT